jgi:hypothetical protein
MIGKFIGVKFYNKLKLKNVKVGQSSVPKKPKFVDILLLPLELKRDVITFHLTHPMP